MFAELWRAIFRTPWQERDRQDWISPETWSLIDARIVARQGNYQWNSRTLSCAINAGLQDYRCRRSAEAGYAVDSLLASYLPFIKDAWIRIRGWYKAGVDRPPPTHPEWSLLQ